MERTTSWVNLGNDFTQNTRTINGVPESMIFSVEKKPMGYLDSDGNFRRVKGDSTVVDEFGRAYGAVSDNYGVIDNAQALGVVEYIDGFTTEKYGSLSNGMQFIIGKVEDMDILGDKFSTYLIFRNSFNGRYPLEMAICPLRIVCQNQLSIGFKTAQNAVHIRHTSKATERIEEAHRIMLGTANYLQELNKRAERWAGVKIAPSDISFIASQLFPITEDMSDRQKNSVNEKLAQFVKAGLSDDLTNFKGTAWGVIQQYADYLTHVTPQRVTRTGEENRFLSVTFDPRAMARLVELINNRVGVAA